MKQIVLHMGVSFSSNASSSFIHTSAPCDFASLTSIFICLFTFSTCLHCALSFTQSPFSHFKVSYHTLPSTSHVIFLFLQSSFPSLYLCPFFSFPIQAISLPLSHSIRRDYETTLHPIHTKKDIRRNQISSW